MKRWLVILKYDSGDRVLEAVAKSPKLAAKLILRYLHINKGIINSKEDERVDIIVKSCNLNEYGFMVLGGLK